VHDSGEPDKVDPQADQHPLEALRVEVLVYLLGSRYSETDRLSDTAWALFGQLPKGWRLVKAIGDYLHNRITFGYQHASPTKPRGMRNEGRGACHVAIITEEVTPTLAIP
jgi:hypothetical protein